MRRFAWIALLLIALPLAGCSDDDPTEPVEELAPLSRLHQISALPDGTAFAVGVEGSSGRLYSNAAGAWGPVADQGPLGAGVTPTGVVPLAEDELFVYASDASAVDRFVDAGWSTETLAASITGGARLLRSGDEVFLLETDGGAVRTRGEGGWEILFDVGTPVSRPSAAVVNGDGDRIVAFEATETDESRILRSDGSSTYAQTFSGRLSALAASDGDTVWAAGDRLIRYHGGNWTVVDAMPDTQRVVAIGLPEAGIVTLVCESGLIYRWSDDAFTLLQEYALVGPLQSAVYVRDMLIYGVVNHIEENTGHEVGIIVRYDGTQWNTDFLAPPAIP